MQAACSHPNLNWRPATIPYDHSDFPGYYINRTTLSNYCVARCPDCGATVKKPHRLTRMSSKYPLPYVGNNGGGYKDGCYPSTNGDPQYCHEHWDEQYFHVSGTAFMMPNGMKYSGLEGQYHHGRCIDCYQIVYAPCARTAIPIQAISTLKQVGIYFGNYRSAVPFPDEFKVTHINDQSTLNYFLEFVEPDYKRSSGWSGYFYNSASNPEQQAYISANSPGNMHIGQDVCSVCGAPSWYECNPHQYTTVWHNLDGYYNVYSTQECSICGKWQNAGANGDGNRQYVKYNMTYKTIDSETGELLATQIIQKEFNSVAKGSDLGTSKVWYNNIPYKYVSETSINKVHGEGEVIRYMKKDSYAVAFDPNTGIGSMATVRFNFGGTYNIPANQFTKRGYSFTGWSTAVGNSVKYADQESVCDIVPAGFAEMTLFANWRPNEYQISYFTRYDEDPVVKIVTFDAPYGELPEPSSTGYKFVGWTLEDGTPIDSTSVVNEDCDHTLIAQWSEDTVDIVFIGGGRTEIIKTLKGRPIESPFIPIQEGYDFLYWSMEPEGEQFDFSKPVDEDATFYAVFEGKDVTLKFGDTEITKKYPKTFGDSIPPVPEIEGRKPIGWGYDKDGENIVKPTDTVPPYDKEFYPIYEEDIHTITLPDGSTIEIRYGDEIPKLPNPDNEDPGRKFTGYEYNGEPVKSGDIYRWDEDIVLAPTWDDVKVIVTFPDGSVKEVTKGDKIGDLPKMPSKPGEVFVGYKDKDGNDVTPDTIVTGDMDLVAVYAKEVITIKLHDSKEPDWESEIQVPADSKIMDLPERITQGYIFEGWSKTPNGKPTNGPFYAGDELYAIYTTETYDIYLEIIDMTLHRKFGEPIGSLPIPVDAGGRKFIQWEDGSHGVITKDTPMPAGDITLIAIFEGDQTGQEWWDIMHNEKHPVDDGTGDDAGLGDDSDFITVYYWSDGVRINTEDLEKGEILYNPGAPAVINSNNRVFQYWTDKDGNEYEFGHQVTSNLDLYAVWKD